MLAHRTALQMIGLLLLSLVLLACGGYEDDGVVEESIPQEAGGTPFFVAVADPTQGARSSRKPSARQLRAGLTGNNFSAVAMVADANAEGGFREVSIEVMDFEDLGEGQYRLNIDGKPRVNCIIFVTVDSVRYKYMALEPGSPGSPVTVSLFTTVATELVLEDVQERGGFETVTPEAVQQVFVETVKTLEAVPLPPTTSIAEITTFLKVEAEERCSINTSTGTTGCPRSVGGTVTGLAGSLTLNLNDSQNLTISSSGPFTFGDMIPIGAAYSVTIRAQPDGLRCFVNQGSGQVGEDNVTAVNVACFPAVAIRGTVSGLIGSLTVALNGIPKVVGANGVIDMGEKIFPGQPYQTNITTQPPGQLCSLRNGAGTVSTTDVTDIEISCDSLQFSVGGTVTGLNGSLTLGLGEAERITISRNGSYAFTQTITFNTTYRIDVISQPVGQVCRLSKSAGIMPPASIEDAGVICEFLTYPVTTTVTNGTLTSANNPTITHGQTTTVTGDGNANHYLTSVSGCGGTAITNTDQSVNTFSYTTGAVTAACTVTATFAPKTYTVTTTVTNGTLTSANNPTITHGQTTTVTGDGNANHYLTSVSGCGGTAITNADQSVNTFSYTTGAVTAACTVTAGFAIKTYTVTFDLAGGTRTGGGALTQSVSHGGAATAPTLNAPIGKAFSSWSVSFNNITANRTVTAVYVDLTYPVTTMVTNGTLTSTNNPTITHGQTTTVTGDGNANHYLTSVSGCGGTAITNADQSVNTFSYTTGAVTAACTVTAGFAIKTYTVTFDLAGGTRTGGGALTQTVSHGGAATAPVLTAPIGKAFSSWSVSFNNITANRSVTAVYVDLTYPVTTTVTNGTLTSTNNPTIIHGQTTTVTGDGNANHYLTSVSGCGGTAITNTDQSVNTFSYTTGAVTAACTVTATFAPKTYAVTTTVTNGTLTSTNNPTITHGQTTTVTGDGNANHYLTSVSGCGGTAITNTDQSINTFSYTTGAVTAACTVTAGFAIKTYTVTFDLAGGTRTGGGTLTQTVSHGGAATAPALNAPIGKAFSSWSVSFNNITSNRTVTAVYVDLTYPVTTTVTNGTLTSTNNPTITHGQTTTVTGDGNANHYLASVSGCGGTAITNTDKSVNTFSYTTGAVTAPCSVEALFESLPFPTNVATQADDGYVTITWPEVAGATHYNLYYATQIGVQPSNYSTLNGGTRIQNITPPYTLTPLTNNTSYFIAITAVFGSNESVAGAQLYAMPTPFVPRGGLNDTGIDQCAGEAGTPNAACPVTGFERQDADKGPDAAARSGLLVKRGSGAKGFDFTKLGNNGKVLAVQTLNWDNSGSETASNRWSCVRDNRTGLIWEIKTNEPGSVSHNEHTYSWYNTNTATNGGTTGAASGGTCSIASCNTETFIQALNTAGLCGASDWRLPTKQELLSILDDGNPTSKIDPVYFPYTSGHLYWTSSPNAADASSVSFVDFTNGFVSSIAKYSALSAIAVRGGGTP